MNDLSEDRIRLQKYLSECGVASRRKSEELISQGIVKVNGAVAEIGDTVDPRRDIVTLRGKKVENRTVPKYIMLHKPRGFVTTMSDELGRKCVASLVEDVGERVYPIGRLDKNSEGLLLLTNDGEIAFQSGASATITGNMLTTVACATIRSDKQMLENLGRDVTPDYLKAEE